MTATTNVSIVKEKTVPKTYTRVVINSKFSQSTMVSSETYLCIVFDGCIFFFNFNEFPVNNTNP